MEKITNHEAAYSLSDGPTSLPYAIMCDCGAHSGYAATFERAAYLHASHARTHIGQQARVRRSRSQS